MARILGVVFATVALLLPSAAMAQRGQQIFDLFLQEAQRELQRQQHRDYERQQRQELDRLHQQFLALWQACHGNDLGACDQALSYPQLNFNDRQVLLRKRSEIIAGQHEATERARRHRIEADAEERRRQREQNEIAERERAHEREAAAQQRQRAEQAERERSATEARFLAVREEQARQWASMVFWIWTLVVAVAAIALVCAFGFFFRNAKFMLRFLERLRFFHNALVTIVRAKGPGATEPIAVAAPEGTPSEIAPAAQQPPAAQKPRDTVGAVAALELAFAYIEEVRDAETPGHDDNATRKHQLNTLSLAAKQLDLAQKLDPDAILEGQVDGVPYRFNINELKAEALLLEGITHQTYDLKRAIPALTAATKLNPNSPRAFYVLGLTYAANRNKAKAAAALERAVALEPKNIVYRKELNRVQSLSAAEIGAYRATRAGERALDTGIVAWNIFAVIWNIVFFPVRVVVGVFRFFRLAGFH